MDKYSYSQYKEKLCYNECCYTENLESYQATKPIFTIIHHIKCGIKRMVTYHTFVNDFVISYLLP